MATNTYLFLLVLCIVILCVPEEGVYAFGAGNIPRCAIAISVVISLTRAKVHSAPSFAFLEGKAFRHGDIVSVFTHMRLGDR